MKPLSKAEQETIIRRSADERYWEISSTDPQIQRLLRQIPTGSRRNWKDDPEWGVWVSLPKAWVKIRTSPVSPAALQQRRRAAARSLEARGLKGGGGGEGA